ncbi:hypothetical protein FRC02_010779 [Tulasnella sp. 418]|nr:hypothetical protein FRC02_010779 [Tulasnella sp. 418]
MSNQHTAPSKPAGPGEKDRMDTFGTWESLSPNRSALPLKFGAGSNYWAEYNHLAKAHDEELIGKMALHLDSLLVFAGIFSAVNSVFIVPSLDLLQPTPSDQTNNLIRVLLNQTVNDPSLINNAGSSWKLTGVAIGTSFLFSGSLACSLLAALGALVGKQWLAHYQKTGQSGTIYERAITRQKKFDGVKSYHLQFILDSVSLLIQFSVSLFLVGLMVYVWDMHYGVALMVIAVVAAGFIVYTWTMLAAIQDPFCPFQSPVTTIVRAIIRSLLNKVRSLPARWSKIIDRQFGVFPSDLENPSTTTPEGGAEKWEMVQKPKDDEVTLCSVDMQTEDPLSLQPDSKNVDSYARSIRWVLKTASDKKILLDAAWNIPTLPTSVSFSAVFTEQHAKPHHRLNFIKDLPGLHGLSANHQTFSHVECEAWFINFQAPAYRRLVSLLQESLKRLVASGDPQCEPDGMDVVVYGRAICHALIGSSHALQGFRQLSHFLEKHSSYSWRSTRGELRVLLACLLNHPGFWEHIEDMDNSWDDLDQSVLPIYIAAISITAPLRYRTEWINQASSNWVSRSPVDSRMLGLSALSLVPLQFVENGYQSRFTIEEMLPYIRDAYKSDTHAFSYTLAALRAYPALQSNISHNHAYIALLRAMKLAVDELHDGNDEYHPVTSRDQRRKHRNELRENLSTDLLKALESILQLVSEKIVSIKSGPNRSGLPVLLNLQDQVLIVLWNAIDKMSWGWHIGSPNSPSPPSLLWQVAAHIQDDSAALSHLLSLILHTVDEGIDFYVALFAQNPSTAKTLMQSLHNDRPETRQLALELFKDRGAMWFSLTTQDAKPVFGVDEFSTAFAQHVGLRTTEDDPNPIMDLVDILKDHPSLSHAILNALHATVSQTSQDSQEVLVTCLDIWSELEPSSSQGSEVKNWLSSEIVEIVINHVKQLQHEYSGLNNIERQQLNPNLPPYLQSYHSHLVESRDISIDGLKRQLQDALSQYERLLKNQYSPVPHGSI